MVRVMRVASLCLIFAGATACATAVQQPRPPASVGQQEPASPPPAKGEHPPSGKLPRDVRPTSYSLELEITPREERFTGHVRIAVELQRERQRLFLHGRGLHVTAARAERAGGAISATFRQLDDEGTAELELAEPLPAGKAVLDLVYDAAFGERLAGLYRVKVGDAAYAFTQFEPVSARQAFPCFDEPAFKAPFDVTLTVASNDVAVSNTLELGSEALSGER